MFPIIWTSARMSNRHDVAVVVAESIDDPVWKTVNFELAARQPPRSNRTNLRVRLNQRDRCGDGVEELRAEAGTTLLVPLDRCGQLGRSRIAEVDRLHRPRICFSIRRLTDSQGSRGISPDSIARMRRSISASQADSASASEGPSRLARSSAT